MAWLLNSLGLALDQQNQAALSIARQVEALDNMVAAAEQETQGECGLGLNHALDSHIL